MSKKSRSRNKENKEEDKNVNKGNSNKESPYVHRFTGYLEELKHNWAYEGTTRTPTPKDCL
tara:strand:- start:347 stop:529 length:183 start_codon:yes stop_codon:yes gene_type:complete